MCNKIMRVLPATCVVFLFFIFCSGQDAMCASLSIDKGSYSISVGGSAVGHVLFTGADTTIGGYLYLHIITPSVASVAPQYLTILRHSAGYGYVDSTFTLSGLSPGQTLFYVTAYYSSGSEIGIQVYANVNVTDCPVSISLEDSEAGTIDMFREFRDTVLSKTPEGRRAIQDYYQHAWEGCCLLLKNPDLLEKSREILIQILPIVNASMEGQSASLTPEQSAEIDVFLDRLEGLAGSALKIKIRHWREYLLSDAHFLSLRSK